MALSIKYDDSILKTLATTGAIIFSSLLDHSWLNGPLTPVMMIASAQDIVAICNYTLDETQVETKPLATKVEKAESASTADGESDEEQPLIETSSIN